jgi:hypothetical protein
MLSQTDRVGLQVSYSAESVGRAELQRLLSAESTVLPSVSYLPATFYQHSDDADEHKAQQTLDEHGSAVTECWLEVDEGAVSRSINHLSSLFTTSLLFLLIPCRSLRSVFQGLSLPSSM